MNDSNDRKPDENLADKFASALKAMFGDAEVGFFIVVAVILLALAVFASGGDIGF